jgi:hypothetical protein
MIITVALWSSGFSSTKVLLRSEDEKKEKKTGGCCCSTFMLHVLHSQDPILARLGSASFITKNTKKFLRNKILIDFR